MFEIYLNNEKILINENSLLLDILHQQGYKQNGFAVAINRTFIPRSTYSEVVLKQNDKIDIILPMQGG